MLCYGPWSWLESSSGVLRLWRTSQNWNAMKGHVRFNSNIDKSVSRSLVSQKLRKKLSANLNMHQTNSGKSPTFIVCSPICPNNCGVVFWWKYVLVLLHRQYYPSCVTSCNVKKKKKKWTKWDAWSSDYTIGIATAVLWAVIYFSGS